MALVLTKKRKEILERLSLITPLDILNYFPRRYVDYNEVELSNSAHQQKVVITATVIDKSKMARFQKSRTRYTIYLDYQDDEIKATVFNREYLYPQIQTGEELIVSGKYDHYKKEIIVSDILFKKNYGPENLLKPVYGLIEGVANKEIVSLIKTCYKYALENGLLDEIIPEELTSKYRLISRKEAYKEIHQPSSNEMLKQALRYLKFEELIIFNLAFIKSRKESLLNDKVVGKKIDFTLIDKFIKSLPYKLTEDQIQAIKAINNDLMSTQTMYRLLQGDVGTGKTLVAIVSLIAVCSSGYQGALMAPTDILARQHYNNITYFFKDVMPLNVALLVSSMPSANKKLVLEQIENGEVDIVVGTHALIQEQVNFKNLGLAIIDEQHRFGVNQRKLLRQKGKNVDLLLMSATPIPRTLALALYGDMDISTLYQFPSGKRNIETKLLIGKSIIPLLDEIDQVIANKRKIYLICPLIDGEESSLRGAIDVYEGLVKYFKGKYKIGLLHGKMADEEKEAIIKEFCYQDVSILVATTVVEVGVDVKSADMMVIYDAERFGLSQLHQLRGRIGRSGQKGKCYLLTNSEDEDTIKRLKFLESCDDGFEISRFDLQIRGPGELSGVKQSGVMNLKIANIVDDLKIFEVSRKDASELYPKLIDPSLQKLKEIVDTYLIKNVEVIE